MKKSEYGEGMVVNLLKFAEHFESHWAEKIIHWDFFINKLKSDYSRLEKYDRQIKEDIDMILAVEYKVRKKFHPDETEKEVNAQVLKDIIELWASGSSDHLYDIQVPKGKSWDKIRKNVAKLQDRGLKMGHGFTKKMWELKDFVRLQRLTRETALMIDKKLGLKNANLGRF